MYAIFKKILKESWRDISPVCKEPAVQLGEHIPDVRIPVIHIGPGNTKGDDFSPVIAGEVQLKAVTPPHRSLPVRSHALENLVSIAPGVMTDGNHCAVYEVRTHVIMDITPAKSMISRPKSLFSERKWVVTRSNVTP